MTAMMTENMTVIMTALLLLAGKYILLSDMT